MKNKHVLLAGGFVLFLAFSAYAAIDDNPHGELDMECNYCHIIEGWNQLRPDILFDHNTTSFPLEGQHSTVDCRSCHSNLVFKNTPSECYTCHTDIHENQFGSNCERCHTPQRWSDESEFRDMHQGLRLPLTGVHMNLECQSCHSSGEYSTLSFECSGCHLDNYVETSNPNHPAAQFSVDCLQCHQDRDPTWRSTTYIHTTAFPLNGGHNVDDCLLCHQEQYIGLSTVCFDCHEEDYLDVTDPPHDNYPQTCELCHTTQEWGDAYFDHNQTQFPLTGAHVSLECIDCHSQGYTGTDTGCFSCHSDDYQGVGDPLHVAPSFSHECEECHTTTAWLPSTFNHNTHTDYLLNGAHTSLSCLLCHTQGIYDGTPDDCWSCHDVDYHGVADPIHNEPEFERNCLVCHTEDSWIPSSFNHSVDTDYVLEGVHATAHCIDCHQNGVYDGTSDVCWSCHQDDYEASSDPNHSANGYPQDCSMCHTFYGWSPAEFNHSQTDFPLTGAHTQLQCLDCHADGFTNTPTDCFACHNSDYLESDNPNHGAAGFGQQCTDCHSTEAWIPSQWDHSSTGWPLEGNHSSVACSECHTQNIYEGLDPECWSCHQDDYEGVVDPDHSGNGYPHDCSMCHNFYGWSPAEFDHDQSDFPLTGAHVGLECVACHADGFAGTPTDCFSCHDTDYNGTDDPDHALAQFSTVCSECHTTEAWLPVNWSHESTGWPLTGSHTELRCIDCHAESFLETSPECFSCHDTDYNETDDPDHALAEFSIVCTECHTTEAWLPADWSHESTGWPLTGSHTELRCIDCHSEGYIETSSACFSCHETDYNGTSTPNHPAAGFSTDCIECHTTEGWIPADWSHDDTGWPLTGSHEGLDCQLCHIDNQYGGTPTACFFCHEDDYNDAEDPDHQGAGFPTDCEECHNTNAWIPADFDHLQYFPIYTGVHRGEWDTCSDCHPNSSDYTIFTCLDCHEHRRSRMNNVHEDVPGYVYESWACYNCHPDGRADDDRFNPNIQLPEPEKPND